MQRRPLLAGLATGLTAAGGYLALTAGQTAASRGRAPEFPGIESWLNTTEATDPAMAGSRTTLVNFWTYSCINVVRTLPYLRRWHAEYASAGLQIVGIHTPEFGFEHLRHNVEAAVRDLDIRYPVGQDNGYRTWRGYNNRAWPAFHLLDAKGEPVLLREGEGHSAELERNIRGLLGLASRHHVGEDADLSRIGTPEIYFGATHPTPQHPAQSPRRGEATYGFAQSNGLRLNRYALNGTWSRETEALVLRSPRGGLRLRFSAAKLHMVATAPQAAAIRVSVDGAAPRMLEIGRPNLYTLLDGTTYGEHLVELEAETPGLTLYSATFG